METGYLFEQPESTTLPETVSEVEKKIVNENVVLFVSNISLSANMFSFDLHHFVANRDSMYNFLQEVGSESIVEFSYIKPTGNIHTATSQTEISEQLLNKKYIIQEVIIQQDTTEIILNLSNGKIEYPESYDINKLLEKLTEYYN